MTAVAGLRWGRQDLSKNHGSGLYQRRITKNPCRVVWIQFPGCTPSGFAGANGLSSNRRRRPLRRAFIFGHLSDQENLQFAAAVAAPGFPQLQIAKLGGASCDFGDFFAAGVVGAILARERHGQLVAAAATFLVTQAFDQLLLVVDSLPATVPPVVVMLGLDARRWALAVRGSGGRRVRRAALSQDGLAGR